MAAANPLDTLIREYLNEHTENQVALAAAIGRDRSWLNKYINGTGKAAIDDIILLAAAFISLKSGRGGNAMLTDIERQLLQAFRALPDDRRRREALAWMLFVRKSSEQEQALAPVSTAPLPHTPAATARTARGKRRRPAE